MRRICSGARAASALCMAVLAACGNSQPLSALPSEEPPIEEPPIEEPPQTAPSINHVVIIFQENRTPDNLFHGLPGADIAEAGFDSSGTLITLEPEPLANDYDLGHTHGDFERQYSGGEMNGADRVEVRCDAAEVDCAPPPNPQFKYVPPEEVAPYFALAQRYTFADRMFQTNQGPSFPAHQYLIAGTSQPAPDSPLFASSNSLDIPGPYGDVGCTAPPGTLVRMIDPEGSEQHFQYPCFEHATIMDLLDERMISWRYYTPSEGSIWTGPNAIAHLRNGPAWSNVLIPETRVLEDLAKGELAQVTWIMPSGQWSDHARINDGSGPDWVGSIVNAIGNSPFWNDTVILIAWDDWGGWFDHVPPPSIYNQYEYGFRVPMIVVSPYAKPGYVSHVTHDFGSLLKFIEVTFDLPTLGYADLRSDDLMDCFDFSQAPLPYETVATTRDAKYFLQQQHPPAAARSDPDDE